jgi:5-methylcytosine-specific restriction endonuclease McrA
MTYSEKLRDPRWQKKRLEILNRDEFTCTICGDDKSTLHVHHNAYAGEPWEADNNLLTTLCENCHFVVENVHDLHMDAVYRLISNRIVNGKSVRFMVNPNYKENG